MRFPCVKEDETSVRDVHGYGGYNTSCMASSTYYTLKNMVLHYMKVMQVF